MKITKLLIFLLLVFSLVSCKSDPEDNAKDLTLEILNQYASSDAFLLNGEHSTYIETPDYYSYQDYDIQRYFIYDKTEEILYINIDNQWYVDYSTHHDIFSLQQFCEDNTDLEAHILDLNWNVFFNNSTNANVKLNIKLVDDDGDDIYTTYLTINSGTINDTFVIDTEANIPSELPEIENTIENTINDISVIQYNAYYYTEIYTYDESVPFERYYKIRIYYTAYEVDIYLDESLSTITYNPSAGIQEITVTYNSVSDSFDFAIFDPNRTALLLMNFMNEPIMFVYRDEFDYDALITETFNYNIIDWHYQNGEEETFEGTVQSNEDLPNLNIALYPNIVLKDFSQLLAPYMQSDFYVATETEIEEIYVFKGQEIYYKNDYSLTYINNDNQTTYQWLSPDYDPENSFWQQITYQNNSIPLANFLLAVNTSTSPELSGYNEEMVTYSDNYDGGYASITFYENYMIIYINGNHYEITCPDDIPTFVDEIPY